MPPIGRHRLPDRSLFSDSLKDPEGREALRALTVGRSTHVPQATKPRRRRQRGWWQRTRRTGAALEVTLNVRALLFLAVLGLLAATLAWSLRGELSVLWITRLFEALSLALVFMGTLGARR